MLTIRFTHFGNPYGRQGVTPHWRNLDDDQIRAIAKSGGVVNYVCHKLPYTFWKTRCINHRGTIEHLIHVGGEKIAAIGTDFDGISTPTDLKTVDQFPMLVEYMLQRWSEERIHNILGGNSQRIEKWKP